MESKGFEPLRQGQPSTRFPIVLLRPARTTLQFAWQRPILAGGDPPTTFGVLKLNFCVRHGNRCILQAIITTLTPSGQELALSKLNNIALLPNLTA